MFSNLKKRLGVLTAIAVMSALVPALSVSPASAAPATVAVAPASAASLSACPASASIAAAGFTDTTSTDVDCIKYYGITTGVTATTYEPSANIPRWQMALYLTRTATVTGHTLGSGADQGFTDISGYSAAIQTAINQLKQLGVTTGTTATTYSPDDNVTKEQMAMFVDRLLTATAAGTGGATGVGVATVLNINTATLTYNYTDIDTGGVTYEGHQSIAELYHLGIPGHAKTVTTFSPAANITRADMATWLTNALGHSKARPAGLNLQAYDYEDWGIMDAAGAGVDVLVVSHRDAAFQPIANTVVDTFGFDAASVVALSATASDTALAADGTCSAARDTVDGIKNTAAASQCIIESGDYATDSGGDVKIEMSSIHADIDVGNASSVQYWAHTGATGAKFDSDTSTFSTVTVTSTKDATHMSYTLSRPQATTGNGINYDNAGADTTVVEAKMGETTTATFQLRSAATAKPVAKAGALITITDKRGTVGAAATGITTTILTTDANGTATYDLTEADPDAAGAGTNDTAKWAEITFSAVGANVDTGSVTTGTVNLTEVDSVGTGDTQFVLQFDDEARSAHKQTLNVDGGKVAYALANGVVGVGTSHTLTAGVYDQYGAAVNGATVRFEAANEAATAGVATEAFADFTRITNAAGEAVVGITRTAATDTVSTYTACSESPADACSGDAAAFKATAEVVYYVAPNTTVVSAGATSYTAANIMGDSVVPAINPAGNMAGDGQEGAEIICGSAATNSLLVRMVYDANGSTSNAVVAAAAYTLVTYDSDDLFMTDAVTDDTLAARTYAEFGVEVATKFPLGCLSATGVLPAYGSGVDIFTGTAGEGKIVTNASGASTFIVETDQD